MCKATGKVDPNFPLIFKRNLKTQHNHGANHEDDGIILQAKQNLRDAIKSPLVYMKSDVYQQHLARSVFITVFYAHE